MRTGKVIVYMCDNSWKQLVNHIDSLSCEGWDSQIIIKSINNNLNKETIEQQLRQDLSEENTSRIFVESNLNVKCSKLKWNSKSIRSASLKTIYREITEELKKRRFFWLSHSLHEWKKSGIQYADPQEWRDQFANLGYSWIGEGLLKQMRVISDAELRTTIFVSAVEQLGLRVAHAYIKDEEAGSSSISIKDTLEHLYTTPVFELDLKAEPPSFIQEFDVIYVYEDGLWSGVELVKRLALLASWQPIKSRDLKVVFRYGATTDAGLLAGRNFIRRERLTPSIEIQNASPIYHYTMLDKMTFNGDLSLRSVLEDDAFRQLLDDRIDPYAFRASNLWKERLTEAIDVCKKIGSQLVRPWLQSTKGGDDLENHVAKWSLGAFGYASMITFSMSVPKPVLPLLWLTGEVHIKNKYINWNPLFWDSRRTKLSPPYRTKS